MKEFHVAGAALAALVLGGCNERHNVATAAGKPVLAYAFAMYTDGACSSWEPPEVSLSTPPSNGRVAHGLVKHPLQAPGNRCDGQMVDYRVSVYTPKPGFRGQDSFTLKYDAIRNDGGGRMVTGKDIIVEVK